jgi:hypothetical protein
MMLTFAHAGHWLPQLAMASPLLILFGIAGWSRLAQRRSGGDGEDPSEA